MTATRMTLDSTGNNITQLLVDWSNGDTAALDRLLPLVQDTLYRLAKNYLRRERPGHTLQTGALINEAFLRMIGKNVSWQNRSHFFGIAARLMRQILVDHARARKYDKRRASLSPDQLDTSTSSAHEQAVELLALNEALMRLTTVDERQAQIVELRFFGGLTIEETATTLGLSHATVEREWAMARAWLRCNLS